MKMPFSFYKFRFFIIIIFFSFCSHSSHGQQTYSSTSYTSCNGNEASIQGYLCNGPQETCDSYITFRSHRPYDSTISVAYLLGAEASEIAFVNNITSTTSKIPEDTLIIVPISCSCSGDYYQHNTLYTMNKSDTYFTVANDTYQGLTTCSALSSQNNYDATNFTIGSQVLVPLRCACPRSNQTAAGVRFLLAYMVTWGDTLTKIAETFGTDAQSIAEANRLSMDSNIYPFMPLLVPLKSETCSSKPESFFCRCTNGFNGTVGQMCSRPDHNTGFPVKLAVLIGVATGCGLLCLVLFNYWLYHYVKKRRAMKRKEKFFQQNGGLLLQQQTSSLQGVVQIKIFAAEELQKATDNYSQSRFLGQGGYGTVYKGMLPDGKIVAVKRSKAVDKNRIEQFINEVVILSQINHRNVVRLYGCCLETEFPLLVYEFISNGTLWDHIHLQDRELSPSWEDRLRIASEVAGAIAYMHSAASVPILHRDIKSSNILLDEKYNPKISDFGTSRSIPVDKTHLTTKVQGTFGYLDPEYFQSSQFTEKSDVYSFGVVLVELLTGQRPVSFLAAEEETNIIMQFISLVRDNQVFKVLDPRVSKEADEEEILAISQLAKSCLRLNGKKRPTMKEVATELEGLRKTQSSLQIFPVNSSMEEQIFEDGPDFSEDGATF